ncbi:hypothetical protein ACS0TY_025118 [Phlomoides rotata]
MANYDEEMNNQAMTMELDLLEERCMSAEMKNTVYKQRAERYYNSQVKVGKFRASDLVLGRVLKTHPGYLARLGRHGRQLGPIPLK